MALIILDAFQEDNFLFWFAQHINAAGSPFLAFRLNWSVTAMQSVWPHPKLWRAQISLAFMVKPNQNPIQPHSQLCIDYMSAFIGQ
jgi:hypothetical protein